MKKHGPPPWGMNRVGCRAWAVMTTFSQSHQCRMRIWSRAAINETGIDSMIII